MRAKKMTPSQNNEAIIFKTEVSIDNKGNLITRHESLPPEPVLKELGNDFYAHLINAVVRHCKADSQYFDEQLNGLLKSL